MGHLYKKKIFFSLFFQVLSSFKALHRTRLKLFNGDCHALSGKYIYLFIIHLALKMGLSWSYGS
jgi:uncharacterized iron-regulated membrane protein